MGTRKRCHRGHQGNDSRHEIRPGLRIGLPSGTRRKGLYSFLRDRRRPSSMMRSIEWKASWSRDAPNSWSTYQNEAISRGLATIGEKIDGAPTRPRSGARPTDIAQPTPEVRTRLPRSGRWATPGPRTTGPQRTTPVTSGPASPEVTDLTRVAASRDPLGLSDTEEDRGSNLSRPRWRHCI